VGLISLAYAVSYHPAVVKEDIPSLGSRDKERIRRAIEQKLMTQPDLFGVPLRRSLKGYWKLRVGDYRVVYRIEGHQVFIFIICHRSDAYRTADRRSS